MGKKIKTFRRIRTYRISVMRLLALVEISDDDDDNEYDSSSSDESFDSIYSNPEGEIGGEFLRGAVPTNN